MGFPADEGLEAQIQDTGGVAVVLGSNSTYGHFDQIDEVVMDGDTQGVIVGSPSVVIPTGALGVGMEIGEVVQVGGTPYTIRDHRRVDDGALTRIFLAE